MSSNGTSMGVHHSLVRSLVLPRRKYSSRAVLKAVGTTIGGHKYFLHLLLLVPLLLKLESIEIRSTCQMDQGHQRLGKVAQNLQWKLPSIISI